MSSPDQGGYPPQPFGQPYGQPYDPGYGQQQPTQPQPPTPLGEPYGGQPAYVPQPPPPDYAQQPPPPDFGQQPPPPEYTQQPPPPDYGQQPAAMPTQPQSAPPAAFSSPPAQMPPGQMPPGQMPPALTQALPIADPGFVPGPTPPARRGFPWTPVLAGVSAVLLVLAAVMTGLFVSKSSDYNDTSEQLANSRSTAEQQSKDLTEKDKQLAGKTKELTDTEAELDKTKSALSGSQSSADQLRQEKEVITKCLQLVLQYIEYVGNNDQAGAASVLPQVGTACEAAQDAID